jgi:hypothetical protein
MTEEPKETSQGVKRKEAPELGEDLPVSPVKVSFFCDDRRSDRAKKSVDKLIKINNTYIIYYIYAIH